MKEPADFRYLCRIDAEIFRRNPRSSAEAALISVGYFLFFKQFLRPFEL
jgi:hypothetical protein